MLATHPRGGVGGALLGLIGPKVLIAVGDYIELLGGALCQGRNPDMGFGAWCKGRFLQITLKHWS